MQTTDQILSLIGQYGYLVVFFGVMLESVGIPLPGETILIAAGLLVHQGSLDPDETIVSGILGTIIGNQLGYWAGSQGRRPVVLQWGHYVGVTHERLQRVEGLGLSAVCDVVAARSSACHSADGRAAIAA